MTHKAQGFTLDDYPNIKRWYAEVRARPQVQAGLAIGKFVKEPFDEEARRNMFGQAAKEMAEAEVSPSLRSARVAEPGDRTQIRYDSGCEVRAPESMTGKPSTKETAMIEFFFDCSSPWTYLAFHNIQPLAKELGVEISWRPILVGGIFNTVNPSVYASRETPVPLKARYMKKDLADWARSAGLAIKMPPTVFPVNSVKAMRGCIWLGKGNGAVRARGVRDLLGRRQGHLAGCGADRDLQARRCRSVEIPCGDRRAGDQGPAQGQYR